jgi:hypothetical protein
MENAEPKKNEIKSETEQTPDNFDEVADILRKKNEGGHISDREFETVLSSEFENFMKKNPPIEEAFSPEDELSEIREMPFKTEEQKEARKAARVEFKDKLVRQSKALAECRTLIEKEIGFDNDVPREKLDETVRKFSTHYGFSEVQEYLVSDILDDYYSYRKNAKQARNEAKDDVSLVQDITGLHHLEKPEFLSVVIGPMSVDITTDNVTANRIYARNAEVNEPTRVAGFQTLGQKRVFYTVQTVNKRESTIAHEREHVKNNVLRMVLEADFELRAENALQEYKKTEAKNSPEGKAALEKYIDCSFQFALSRAKDEFIAHKKGNSLPGAEKDDYVRLFSSGIIPQYDYLKPLREKTSELQEPEKGIWLEMLNKYTKKFISTIDASFSAFELLQYEGGYTTDEIIALFTDKSLLEWKSFARRLLAGEETKTTDMEEENILKSGQDVKKNVTERPQTGLSEDDVFNLFSEKKYKELCHAMHRARETNDRTTAEAMVKVLKKDGIYEVVFNAITDPNWPESERKTLLDGFADTPGEIQDFLNGNILEKN